jgi:hypothetical protein
VEIEEHVITEIEAASVEIVEAEEEAGEEVDGPITKGGEVVVSEAIEAEVEDVVEVEEEGTECRLAEVNKLSRSSRTPHMAKLWSYVQHANCVYTVATLTAKILRSRRSKMRCIQRQRTSSILVA